MALVPVLGGAWAVLVLAMILATAVNLTGYTRHLRRTAQLAHEEAVAARDRRREIEAWGRRPPPGPGQP
jgi:hypothetical protein